MLRSAGYSGQWQWAGSGQAVGSRQSAREKQSRKQETEINQSSFSPFHGRREATLRVVCHVALWPCPARLLDATVGDSRQSEHQNTPSWGCHGGCRSQTRRYISRSSPLPCIYMGLGSVACCRGSGPGSGILFSAVRTLMYRDVPHLSYRGGA